MWVGVDGSSGNKANSAVNWAEVEADLGNKDIGTIVS